jgi:hypothetical protein
MAKFEFSIKLKDKSIDEKVLEAKDAQTNFLDTSFIKLEKFELKTFERVQNIIKEICTIPNVNEQYRIITHKSFTAYDWVVFICGFYEAFEEVYFLSYNFSEKPIHHILKKFDDKIFEKCTCIISHTIMYRTPKIYNLLKQASEERSENFRVAGIFNHSKIILMKPKNSEHYLVIEGSGNFSQNAYIEQYVFDNSKNIYNFHKKWIESVFEIDKESNKQQKSKLHHFVL